MRLYLHDLGSRTAVGSSLYELLSRHPTQSGNSAKAGWRPPTMWDYKQGTRRCGTDPIVAAAIRVNSGHFCELALIYHSLETTQN